MLQAGSVHIVNITAAIEQPAASLPSALASLTKGGLDAVTRALVIEYAKREFSQCRLARRDRDADACARDARLPRRSAARWAAWASTQDVVDAVLYLEQAPFVTGEILHVDGGAHAGHW